MLKCIFVDNNNQKNYCQLVSDLGRLIHGPLALFRIGANLEGLEREWSELTVVSLCGLKPHPDSGTNPTVLGRLEECTNCDRIIESLSIPVISRETWFVSSAISNLSKT